jgi:hypothetical protein
MTKLDPQNSFAILALRAGDHSWAAILRLSTQRRIVS